MRRENDEYIYTFDEGFIKISNEGTENLSIRFDDQRAAPIALRRFERCMFRIVKDVTIRFSSNLAKVLWVGEDKKTHWWPNGLDRESQEYKDEPRPAGR